MKIPIDVIFFDVDGTLVDARKDIVNAVNFALKGLKLKPKPFSEIVSYIGTGVKDLIRQSLGEEYEPLMDRAVKLFAQRYEAHPIDEAKVYPYVVSTLDHFKNKRKFIVTNRYARFADVALKGLGLRGYFESIIGGDDEGCLKPSACVITKVISRLNVPKTKIMIVGDMAIDVRTGKNAGIKTCFVTYGLGAIRDLGRLKPDYIIDGIADLKNKIE